MRRLVALALALSLVGSSALSAQKPKKEKGKSQEAPVTVVFSDTQREAARSYFVTQHCRGNCPPGLAKKTRRRTSQRILARVPGVAEVDPATNVALSHQVQGGRVKHRL